MPNEVEVLEQEEVDDDGFLVGGLDLSMKFMKEMM